MQILKLVLPAGINAAQGMQLLLKNKQDYQEPKILIITLMR